ncbi:glycerol dehydrogenase [Companilactobacillus sp. DQM5]|uniref:glycerol dehydrogenase n=1 Tax=Companilactobacillus sp. DQM5 TaxID=3463359 RepID=UPI0040590FE7
MDKMFVSPDTYIQGSGLLEHSAEYIKKLGKHILIMSDETVWKIVGDEFADYLLDNDFEIEKVVFNGEASVQEIERITKIAKDKKVDVVVGLGGGKTIDTSKGIALEANTKLVIAPTAASADAPTAGLSVLYTEDGVFDQYKFYPKHSDLVLLDTKVIANAPVRTLVSGISDAMATNIEAKATAMKHGVTMGNGAATFAGRAIAAECERVIWDYAYEAVESNKNKVVTPAIEAIVEANTLLSGLGFENAGLAAAHAIHNGFTAVKGEIHHLTHGEKVAFGSMVELVLEDTPHDVLDKYINFWLTLGLPITMEDTHLDQLSEDELMQIGKLATAPDETMKNMPFEVTPEMVVNAMKAASAYVNAYRKSHDIKPIFERK